MLLKGKTGPETDQWNSKTRCAVGASAAPVHYSSAEFCKLTVFDLYYYYKKASTVEMWWKSLDGNCGGTIKIARM